VTDVEVMTLQAFCAGMEPEPVMTLSEWADAFRILSPKASAEPGRWRTDRTPYMRAIMDDLSVTNTTERVVVMAGAQVGKTEGGNNWTGYVIDQAPAPMLIVQPTVEVAKRVSKQRIAPMIEASPRLRVKVKEARSKDSGNTMLVKEFDGGLLIITGANSAAGLRSMPIRNLFLDEVDEYPGDLDGQGDPVSLAEKRTTTFARRKILMTSTPTIKGLSRIEREYLASDQRRYFLRCPLCGAWDFVRWENIRWEPGKPETAALCCVSCTGLIPERFKAAMLEGGEWRPTAPGDGRTHGYHIPSMLSPPGWKSWAECVAEFLAAREDPFRLKTWVNTVLGESWEERGESIGAGDLAARLEVYAAELPHGVGFLTAAVDVQGDRLEVQVKGWGGGEESWLVAFSQLHGDPSRETVWRELDTFLTQGFRHASGRTFHVERAVIDSGGAHTEQVYRYCKARQAWGFYPIKGGSLTGRPLVERPTTTNRYRVPLFVLCVDTGKDQVAGRLRVRDPGPGFMHLPSWVDEEYLAQLTAEKAIRKYDKKRGLVREWVKLRERNEAFDLEVYSLACLHIAGAQLIRSLPERAAEWSKPLEGEEAAEGEPAARDVSAPRRIGKPRQRPRPGGWVNRY
jgi:phage terminase large subunit GpA-like protein